MKRLVVCCDGTWNRPDDKNITNVEKIARTVSNDISRSGGVEQEVLYLSGVGGAGYHADRILGGAFGFGLFSSVLAGYRHLALNYTPGDEIYIFGFSRGAYTARSLAGMIGSVGLLTRASMVKNELRTAVDFYKGRKSEDATAARTRRMFREEHCHAETPIHFLGVFDTVGALGVPGALSQRHRFHNVDISASVRCARQALAIDEQRMKFEPSLWTAPPEADREEYAARVRQVWFEGVHSDIGGGYTDTGLSDTALLWMAAEAARCGLLFDESLLEQYLKPGSKAERHDSDKLAYKVLDLAIRTKIALRRAPGTAFTGGLRKLDRPDCLSVKVAEPAAAAYREGRYRPSNVEEWARACDDFADCVEPVITLPAASYEALVDQLRERGIALSAIPEGGSPADAGGGDAAGKDQMIPKARSPETESRSVR